MIMYASNPPRLWGAVTMVPAGKHMVLLQDLQSHLMLTSRLFDSTSSFRAPRAYVIEPGSLYKLNGN